MAKQSDSGLGVVAIVAGLVYLFMRKPANPPPPNKYSLTIAVQGQGATTPSPGTYNYDAGQTVSVQATPMSGWQFSAWSDGSTDNPRTVLMTTNVSLTAVFTEVAPPPPTNTITFGQPSAQAVAAYDAQGYPLSFRGLNFSCQVTNQGPATTRTIELWEKVLSTEQPMRSTSFALAQNESRVYSYSSNPVVAGSIILQINTAYEFYLKDAESGAVSAAVTVQT
jgi:hypothetical protein